MLLFERIEKLLETKGSSRQRLAKQLGVPQVTFNRYFCEEQQDKLAQHLWAILKIFPDLRRDWLFFDEGDILSGGTISQSQKVFVNHQAEEHILPFCSADGESIKSSTNFLPIPLIGFAACGINGWMGTMTIPVPVDPPAWHEGMIAVMATGESMLPAGIGHGQICFCDTTKSPGPGEAVYLELQDNTGAIKVFMNRSADGKKINVQGWSDRNGTEQLPFNVEILSSFIKRMAPVIYVRRRL